MEYTFQSIAHVQLAAPVGCEEKARAFFNGILGMEELEKPDNLKKKGGIWFGFGPYEIHIGVQHDFIPATKAHPAFEVGNLEALKRHLLLNGVHIIEDGELPGASRFYAADPFGNRIEFLEWNE
ncbi:MAG: VOC family protein [Bacillus sp. (in: firmicutes)]